MREKIVELIEHARYWSISEELADILIANDVVPVVRCKECKHWCYEYDDIGLCVTDVPDIDGVQRTASDFCSYGEKT